MPAIYLLDRRTAYGGDDLHLLALFTAAARVLQLLCYAVLTYHIVHHIQKDISSSSASMEESIFGSDTQDWISDKDDDYNDNYFQNNQGQRLSSEINNDDASSSSSCRHFNAHTIFPILFMSYTAGGIVFDVGSLILLGQIYHVSSQGCPTHQRQWRTQRIQQLLEWLFLPVNFLHALIWMCGLAAIILAYGTMECMDYQDSTLFTVLWVFCALLCLLIQGIEIWWNIIYVYVLIQHDPHALQWIPGGGSSRRTGLLTSYHGDSSSNFISNHYDPQQQQSSSPIIQNSTTNLDLFLEDSEVAANHELVEQMWADRCHHCCRCLGMGTCYMFGGRELYGSGAMYYGDIARALADYLETRGTLDVVPSDIITGLLVLQQLQTQRQHYQRQVVLQESRHSMYHINHHQLVVAAAPASEQSLLAAPAAAATTRNVPTTNSAAGLNQRGSIPNGAEPLPTLAAATATTNNNGSTITARSRSMSPQNKNVTPAVLLQSMGAGTMPAAAPPCSISNTNMSTPNNSPSSPSNQLLWDNDVPPVTPSLLRKQQQQQSKSQSSLQQTPLPPYKHSHLPSNGSSAVPPPAVPATTTSSSSLLSNNNNGTANSCSDHNFHHPITAGGVDRRKGFQRVLSQHNAADMMILQHGARYANYALAIYTWYLYLYVHPITGVPKLCAKSWKHGFLGTACSGGGCCCCLFSRSNEANNSTLNNNNDMVASTSSNNLHATPGSSSSSSRRAARLRRQPSSASSSPTQDEQQQQRRHYHHRYRQQEHNHRWEGDNICQAHKNALLLTAKLEQETDLVYLQLKSSMTENPYCILLDHEDEVVVVSVRGTFSLEDCVTDVLLEPESLEALGDEFGFSDIAQNQHCHGGVLACARNVYRDLQRHGTLEYLLETKYPHYQLRLVGHSLGAACSTVLGFMLRPTYPTLQCFNYSPPGCSLTWNMAMACQSWCTSFVLDTELVPRLSFEALEQMRDDVLELIGRIRVPKIEVARRVAAKNLWCTGGQAQERPRPRNEFDLEQASESVDELDDLLHDLLLPEGAAEEDRQGVVGGDDDATSYRQQLEQFRAIQAERRNARGDLRSIRLFPPGRILHLVKTDEERSCWIQVAHCVTCCTTNAGSQYTPVWIGNGDLHEIVVSPTMGTDHFPDRMVKELQGIVRDYGLARDQENITII
jgi:hypothetical protein